MTLSIPEIRDAVAADFLERGISARVEFGDYKVWLAEAADVVIFGLAGFEPADPANFPSPLPLETTIPTYDARIVLARNQVVPVWVHAAPHSDTTDTSYPQLCQAAAATLLDHTLRALFVYAHGAFSWRSGKWPIPERVEFTHGSLATFEAVFRIPVMDDAMERIEGDDISTEATSEYE